MDRKQAGTAGLKALAAAVFIMAGLCCLPTDSSDDDTDVTGLVMVKSASYDTTAGAVKFVAAIQFGGNGQATAIEWEIRDGSTMVQSGTVSAATNADGIGFEFVAPEKAVSVDRAAYQGHTLVLALDPDWKVSSTDNYTGSPESWKNEDIAVP